MLVKARDKLVPAAWPPLLVLGAVLVMATGLMIFDIGKDVQAEARTNELVDNTLRSVALIDDLRREVHALAAGSVERDVLANAIAQIARDAAEYDPLATSAGERGEWMHVRGLLARLQRSRVASAPAIEAGLLRDIDASLDRIVQINQREAGRNVAAIEGSFTQDFTVDAVGGTIMLALAFVVGAALLRSIRRQRALLAAHLELDDARQVELEAFAGRVAHELRGPLSPLRGYADLLQLGGAHPPEEIGHRIANATDRMTAIIDDLLTLSISGRPGVGETDVAPVIMEILADARSQLADAKVELAIADAKVRCPPGALGRIVQNLVSNAIKYRAPDHPLELAITAIRLETDVELVVSDNGIGMDEVTAAHAWDPLFRGGGTRKIPGHGLGLAIVKRTVDSLGGSCRVDSKLGDGTRISVRLPA